MYLVSNDGKLQFALATQDSAVWNQAALGGYPSISYSLGAKKLTVKLACVAQDQAKFEALGESPINVYSFLLSHPCVCWDGCKGE